MSGILKHGSFSFVGKTLSLSLFIASTSLLVACSDDSGSKEPVDTNPPQDSDGNCNPGFWDHDGTKNTTCVPWSACEPGSFVVAEGTRESDRMCEPCAEGAFTDSENQSQCTTWAACESGAYLVAAGSPTSDAVCEVCKEGTYDDDGDVTTACVAQTQCEPGSRVDVAGSTTSDRTCVACEDGTFTDAPNLDVCSEWTECQAGSFQASEPSAVADTLCEVCPEGTYDDDDDASTACVAWTTCAAGEFVSTAGSPTNDRVCTACASGEFSSDENQASCEAWAVCAPGTLVTQQPTNTQNRGCAPCNIESFSTTENSATCSAWSDCEAGQFVAAAGTNVSNQVCSDCGANEFSPEVNSPSCTALTVCAPGSSVVQQPTSAQDRTCAACPTGTCSDQANANSCVSWTTCSAGQTETSAPSATSNRVCEACAPGTWDHDSNPTTACVAWDTCDAGTYVASEGSATANRDCALCSNGSYSTAENQSSCTQVSTCAAGTYIASHATPISDVVCSACSAGTYTSAANQESCEPWDVCGAGTFVSTIGSATTNRACGTCQSGTYSEWDNQGTCQPWRTCNAGNYVLLEGSVASDRFCASCEEGTFTAVANQSTCSPFRNCEAGTYVSQQPSSTNDRACTGCVGSYSTTTNAEACTPWTSCGPGTQFTYNGAGTPTSNATCESCPGNTWDHDSDPSTYCQIFTNCEPGTYTPVTPSATNDRDCQACPAQTFAPSWNALACDPWSQTSCPIGYVFAEGSDTEDSQCIPNHYPIFGEGHESRSNTRIDAAVFNHVNQHIAIAGYINSEVTIPAWGIATAPAARETFFIVMDRNGNLVNSHLGIPVAGLTEVLVTDMDVDPLHGNYYMVGTGKDTNGHLRGWIALFARDNGQFLQAILLPLLGGHHFKPHTLRVASHTNIFVAGAVHDPASVGGTAGEDGAIVSMTFEGHYFWSNRFIARGNDVITDIEFLGSNVIVAAHVDNTLDNNWGLAPTSNAAVWLAALKQSDGTGVWSKSVGEGYIHPDWGSHPILAVKGNHIVLEVGGAINTSRYEARFYHYHANGVLLDWASWYSGSTAMGSSHVIVDSMRFYGDKLVVAGITQTSLENSNEYYSSPTPFYALLNGIENVPGPGQQWTTLDLDAFEILEFETPFLQIPLRFNHILVDTDGELWLAGGQPYQPNPLGYTAVHGYVRPVRF